MVAENNVKKSFCDQVQEALKDEEKAQELYSNLIKTFSDQYIALLEKSPASKESVDARQILDTAIEIHNDEIDHHDALTKILDLHCK